MGRISELQEITTKRMFGHESFFTLGKCFAGGRDLGNSTSVVLKLSSKDYSEAIKESLISPFRNTEIAEEQESILSVFPYTKTLVSFVCRMNREPIRSPARSVANLEFHHTGDEVNEIARNKERNLLPAFFLRRIRIKGSPLFLKAFGKCVPS